MGDFTIGIVGAIAGAGGAGVAFAGFWLMLGGRIQKGESDSESALQIAAENGEAIKSLVKAVDDLRQHSIDALDAARREFGETGDALRTKIHEIEKWARDEFVRRGSFEIVLARSEKTQADRDERIERRLDRIEVKLEEAAKAATSAAAAIAAIAALGPQYGQHGKS